VREVRYRLHKNSINRGPAMVKRGWRMAKSIYFISTRKRYFFHFCRERIYSSLKIGSKANVNEGDRKKIDILVEFPSKN
jgi:hypothetical protein